MARITVEDCLENVENRFALVMLATKRTRQLLTTNIDPLVPWENDKATVVALREIAAGLITSKSFDENEANRARAAADGTAPERTRDEIARELTAEFQRLSQGHIETPHDHADTDD